MPAGTLEKLAQQVGLALQPLQSELTSANIIPFLAELGLQFPPQLLQPSFVTALNQGAAAAGSLTSSLVQLSTAIENDEEGAIASAGLQVLQQTSAIISALQQLGTELDNLAGSLGMDVGEVSAFAQNLAEDLLGYLLISYLETVAPTLVGVANLLGALDYLPNPGKPGDPTHPPFISRKLKLARFGKAVTNPQDALQVLYNWGSPTFDGDALLERLSASLALVGILPDIDFLPTSPGPWVFSLFSIQSNPASTPPGLIASLTYDLPENFTFSLPMGSVWSIGVDVKANVTAGLQATIIPPTNINLAPPSGTVSGQLESDLTGKAIDAAHPIIVVGQTGGSRLQADSLSFGVGIKITWQTSANVATAEPTVTMAVQGGKLVIDTTDADGFLTSVLSGIHVEAGFNLTATWAPDTGIHITGGAQLEIDLPLHLTLGPITIPTVYIIAGASDAGIPIELSAALGLTLGPIQASVDRIGLKGLLSFPDHGGNLGPADFAITFKPPNGLGIAIDAGAVAGGGYILFYPDKGQYAGVLDVALAEIIQVKVIGILDTILPDGSKGFSFLLIITFDFPPIQLGFGFTLNGVGGLGGVNRTMNIDALQAGFRAHTLNNVLFPPNPIANATQIIGNVEKFFPPAEGRYLFGPMLEVGWGTPTVITFAVGVFLEVPDPVRLSLLGLIDAGLPTAEVALIEFHADVFGVLDFGAKSLSIDGSLYDSRVLVYPLAGDAALRLYWGDDPNFVFSLGGFNPHFNTRGLAIPSMQQLTVSIGDGDNPRISAKSYFAITSNTVQFGANVEAYAAAAGFAIHGYLGFDVLMSPEVLAVGVLGIIFSPIAFEFDFAAGFDVSFEGHSLCGLHVDGLFSGPRPWHLHGDASIDILFFSVSVALDLTWGDSAPAIPPPQVPVLPDLLPALQDPRNWSAILPSDTTQAVTLSAPKPGQTTLRVHPIGVLSIRQKVVPLDLPIARYRNAVPSDGSYFAISDVEVNTSEEPQQPIQDYFAAGQFFTLSDADKVSAPSFEKFDAGVTIGSSDIINGSDSPRTVMYEERYIDEPTGFSRFVRLYAMPATVHLAMTRLGAGFASPLKNSGLFKYDTGAVSKAVKTVDPPYVVTHVEDLSVRSDIVAPDGGTYFHARAALDRYLALHPDEAMNLQIVPLHEVPT